MPAEHQYDAVVPCSFIVDTLNELVEQLMLIDCEDRRLLEIIDDLDTFILELEDKMDTNE